MRPSDRIDLRIEPQGNGTWRLVRRYRVARSCDILAVFRTREEAENGLRAFYNQRDPEPLTAPNPWADW